MKFVLDSSAIINGFKCSSSDQIFVSSSVMNELKRKKSNKELGYLLMLGAKIERVDRRFLDIVETKAKETGDIGRLSSADINVIGLALQEKGTIVSDDYSIQNLAHHMNIDFLSIAENGIKEEFSWRYRCSGCGRYYREYVDICAICGSRIRTKRAR